MSKKQKLTPNDERANVMNPNNEAFIANQKNRAKQLDPNHLESKPAAHPVVKALTEQSEDKK